VKNIQSLFLLSVLSISISATSAFAESADLKTVPGVKTPESVASGPDGRVYVSEIAEFNKDGDGQISMVDTDGQLKVFATGMDDPKGLVFVGKDLYVADKTRVLKVAPDGKWEVFAAADAFPIKPQFLNDLAADGLGNVYVSDSGDLSKGGAIFRISKRGKVTTIVDSSNPLVLAPNGLLLGPRGTLLEVDFASGTLYSIKLKTKEMTKVAEGFGGGDGLLRAPNGVLYLSDWKGGRVFTVDKKGKVQQIKDGFKSAADIGLSPDRKSIIVPDMKAGELVWLPIQ
jgi:hypothetical protein